MENLINALSWIDTIAPTVWIALTVIMFWILYKVYGKEGKKHPVFRFGVFLLILVWLYPLYTYVFNQFEVSLAGNLITLWATLAYRKRLMSFGRNIANWMLPQLIWIGIAVIYVGLLVFDKWTMS